MPPFYVKVSVLDVVILFETLTIKANRTVIYLKLGHRFPFLFPVANFVLIKDFFVYFVDDESDSRVQHFLSEL